MTVIVLGLLAVTILFGELLLLARFGGHVDDGIGSQLPERGESDQDKISRALLARTPGSHDHGERS